MMVAWWCGCLSSRRGEEAPPHLTPSFSCSSCPAKGRCISKEETTSQHGRTVADCGLAGLCLIYCTFNLGKQRDYDGDRNTFNFYCMKIIKSKSLLRSPSRAPSVAALEQHRTPMKILASVSTIDFRERQHVSRHTTTSTILLLAKR